MPDNDAKPKSRPILELDKNLGSKKELARIRDNFSAIALAGEHLWLGVSTRHARVRAPR